VAHQHCSSSLPEQTGANATAGSPGLENASVVADWIAWLQAALLPVECRIDSKAEVPNQHLEGAANSEEMRAASSGRLGKWTSTTLEKYKLSRWVL